MQLAALTVLALAWVSGCAQLRSLTYPSDFHYLDKSDVQNAMQAMARHVDRLNTLVQPAAFGHDAQPRQVPQNEVVSELQALARVAGSLSADAGPGDQPGARAPMTNHLLIDAHIGDFIEQIDRARWLAESDPPDYYGVGQLTGNCMACHRLR